MADVYRDGILYNTSKAYKNGQEYLFDWTLLAEYNQLQERYNQLQEAYEAALGTTNGLTLYPFNVTGEPRAPSTRGLYSFSQDGVSYGCVLSTDAGYDDTYDRLFVGFRKRDGYDIEYFTVGGGGSNHNYGGEAQCWKNSTSLRYFFTYSHVNNPYTGNTSYFLAQIDWDYKNGASPVWTSTTGGPSTRISDYTIDTTGYTQWTTSDWVKNVGTREWEDEGYIYLILGNQNS